MEQKQRISISVSMIEGGIKKIDLIGWMDIDGTQEIAMKLTAESSVEKALVMLDLSRLDFMASIGIGTLMSAARSLKLRKGKMVLLNPKPVVALVLERTNIQLAIPVCQSIEEAKKALFGSTP